MDWFKKEWEIQWPLIRFEIYRWGGVAAAGSLIALGAKLLHSVFKVPDPYLYGSLFVLACVCFAFFASRMPKNENTSPPKQTTEALSKVAQQEMPNTVQQMEDHYNSLDVLFTKHLRDQIVEQIKKVPQGPEREEFVLQGLVALAVTSQMEETWYSIYGSQLKAIELLNTGQVKRDALLPFYIAAAAGWPQTYSKYTFDQLIGWMRTQELIIENGDLVGITIRGHALLGWMHLTQRSSDMKSL